MSRTSDTISRSWLLAQYDKLHKGRPGMARRLIEEAPDVPPPEPLRCRDCAWYRMHGGDMACFADGVQDLSFPEPSWFCGDAVPRQGRTR